jgi:hypothetical protein
MVPGRSVSGAAGPNAIMVAFADFTGEHLLSGRFGMDPRVFGDEIVLQLDVEHERLDVRPHDGWRQHVDLSRGESAYSL